MALCGLAVGCGDDSAATGDTTGSSTGSGSEAGTQTAGDTESADESGETGADGSPSDCSGWEMLGEFFPEVSIDDLGPCEGAGEIIEQSLMNFEGIEITGESVVGADGSSTATPCVEVRCDAQYAYIASNALPHYDPQAQPIFDTIDTPIVHRVPLVPEAISSDVEADDWLDVAGCQSALSMDVEDATPEFPPSSHCYFESEEGDQTTGEHYVTDGEQVLHKVLCYGQTGSMITGIPSFAPCEEARPDPYGSPLFRSYEDPNELFVDYCGTHPAAITHNHWINEVCLEQDDDGKPVNSYATGAATFVVEELDSAGCTETSDIVAWSYDGYPMLGSCVCMARGDDGACTDLRRARSGYVYSGLGRWADDAAGDPNITTEAVAASHLSTELMDCTDRDECCPEGAEGECSMYCQPLLVDAGDGTISMEQRCVSANYTWCTHEYVEHASTVEDDGYVYLDRCNGVETADGYVYVGTPTFPYVNSCYRGEPTESALDDTYIRLDVGGGGGGGGPGGGGPGGGG